MDEAIDLVKEMSTGSRIRLIGINWDMEDGVEFNTVFKRLDTDRGIDEQGGNMNIAQLQGAVHTPLASQSYFRTLQSRYPYVTFTADELTNMVKQFLEGTMTEYVDDEVETISAYAFNGMTMLTRVDAPNATSIDSNAFNGCTAMQSMNAPLVTNISGDNVFRNCSSFVTIEFPLMTSNVVTYMLGGCSSLEAADLGIAGQVLANSMNGCSKLTAIFLRKTSLATLQNVSAFNSTKYATTGAGGAYVYVPRDLISTYQSAANWATLYAAHSDMFRPLEDYTVDGTTTGAIDWDKVNV